MSGSPIEKLFREAAARLWPDTPRLVQEHPVTAGGRSYRLDFAVTGLKKGVELDGHATHSRPEDIARNRLRQRDLEDAGWAVRRYGGQEVTRDATAVVRDVLKWCGLTEREQKHCLTCRCGEPAYQVIPSPVPAFTAPLAAMGFRPQPDPEYTDRLWQCRKLCLRAMAFQSNAPGFKSIPLKAMDQWGWWDAYPHRYDYTHCVHDRVTAGSRCEHGVADEERSGCHCTGGLTCPNNCGHQWYACRDCKIKFPFAGQEQAWLDCPVCGASLWRRRSC